MRIISKHESTMDRQLTEAVRISRILAGDWKENLNAKAEWGIPRTSTLGITIRRKEGMMWTKQEERQEGTDKERNGRVHNTGMRKRGRRNETNNDEMKGKRKLWKPKNEEENHHDHVKRKRTAEKEEEEERENKMKINGVNENNETKTETVKTRREKS